MGTALARLNMLLDMTPGEMIKAAIKEKRTSQREIARKLGISESAVSQWVADGTYPDRQNLQPLCELLGLDYVAMERADYERQKELNRIAAAEPHLLNRMMGAAEKAAFRKGVASVSAPSIAPPSPTLPVWASAEGGDGAMIINSDPIDSIARPEGLTARDAFSVYLVGDSMSPAYEHGDRLFINPSLPAWGGADCLFMQAGSDGTYLGLAKRLIRPATQKWRVRQFNPAKDFDLERKQWAYAWPIVGKMNRSY